MGVGPGAGGGDAHLAANHTGPYLLTRLLLPHMRDGRGRVVNVASRAHLLGKLSVRWGGGIRFGWGRAAHAGSLAAQLGHDVALAIHPIRSPARFARGRRDGKIVDGPSWWWVSRG